MSVVLSEHLPLLASAPDGIQKLRGLILELAVRGKLVPQDPNDEPARELLKRIARERSRLEAEGACKKSKPRPTVGEDGLPFKLPENWVWTELATISLINPRNAADDSIEASFVPMAMIGNRFEGSHQQELRKWGEVKQGFTHFAEGDIGVAKITPCFENSKACVFAGLKNGVGAGTTELHVVRPIGQTLVPRYVLAYVKAPMFLAVGETKMTGTAGQKRLPKDFLEANPFPLPPLAEQHRIVSKVDELMALCDRLEAEQADAGAVHAQLVDCLLGTLTQSTDAADLAVNWQRLAEHFDTLFTTESSLDALKQTILQLAVMGKLSIADANDESVSALLERVATTKRSGCETKLGRDWVGGDDQPIEAAFQIPSNWHWVRITEVVERVTVGYVGSMKSQYVDQGIPFLRSQNVRPNKFREDGLIRISPEFHRSIAKSALCPGDVVVVRSGAVGTACVIPPSLSDANCSDLVVIKKPIGVLPDFLCFYLNSLAAKHISEGTVGIALTHFNTKSVALMPLPLPPFAEQRRIVAKVDELMVLCDRLKADLAESRRHQDRLASTLIESALKAA